MKSIRSLFAATLALLAPALHAATVQFAGVITDNAGSQITQWRTAGAAKTLDADGDNVFGTTARVLFGLGQFGQGTVFSFDSSDGIVGPFPGYATVDDVNGGTDVVVRTTTNNGVAGADRVMFTFTAQAGCPADVRIGVATDGLDGAQFSPASIGLRKVGGSSAEQSLSPNNSLDMVFFDVKGVVAGDQFQVFGDTGTGGFATIQFVTFDAIPPNAPIVVTTANDAGPGSLRAALAQAAAQAGADTIIFDALLNGKTIGLLSSFSDLLSGEVVTVDASALSAGVKLDGGLQGFRFFQVNAGASLTLHGLTLTRGGGAGFGNSGGAIKNSGTLTLTRCTLSGNRADSVISDFGGAIYNTGTGTATLTHCTLSGNSASNSGGAIETVGTLALTHCTVSSNSALNGGGVTVSGSSPLTLTNTIVAGNSSTTFPARADVANFGTITRVGANVVPALLNIGDGTVTGSGTISTSAPSLASLGNYGGPRFPAARPSMLPPPSPGC